VVDERSKRPAFGALLRSRRVAAGFTQDHLAERARISVQAVSALERGARNAPRGDTLALLTQALELDGDALIEFEAAARASTKLKIRSTQPLFKPPSQKRASLPKFATPFFGRDRESRDLASAIAGGGCTTLWGTGGVGKTRLAVETSAAIEDRFEAITFVALAASIGDDAVDDALAAAFGIAREPDDDVLARIAAELARYRRLVIVDNCEHVIADAARTVGALAAASPETVFVCTSREPLRIPGERVIELGSLAEHDARSLFVDRAGAVTNGGELSAADTRDVTTICRRLDGIPLALELAAACARFLDLHHVASGLDGRFRLLTRGKRAASDRHTTLHATIAWSYDLLDPSERRVFERAAIINGHFSLDDLLAIAVVSDDDHATVLAATAALAEKALIVVETDATSSQRRYRLLESTRAFALEVAEARESGAMLRDAHRRWGRYLADRLHRASESYRKKNTAPVSDAHLDHLRGYLDWAIDKRHDVRSGTALAGEIHLLWDCWGLHVEGIRRIETGLALLTDDDADAWAAMHGWYAVSRLNQRLVRNAESLAPALRAYELAARTGDDLIRAQTAAKLAIGHDATGKRQQAIVFAEEAIASFERAGDPHSAAYTACTAAAIAFKIRGDAAALDALRTAVDRLRTLGDVRRTASAELDLGDAYFAYGRIDAAIDTVRSAIAQLRMTAPRYELAIGLSNLQAYLSASARAAEAVPFALEALEIAAEGRYTRFVVLAAQTCATIAALDGREKRRCAHVFGYVSLRYKAIGEIGYTEAAAHKALCDAVHEILLEPKYAEYIRAGEECDDDAAIDAALRCASDNPVALSGKK
jgi:predicted ATPase/transcriptional regulator with XRE-family HTH domain